MRGDTGITLPKTGPLPTKKEERVQRYLVYFPKVTIYPAFKGRQIVGVGEIRRW